LSGVKAAILNHEGNVLRAGWQPQCRLFGVGDDEETGQPSVGLFRRAFVWMGMEPIDAGPILYGEGVLSFCARRHQVGGLAIHFGGHDQTVPMYIGRFVQLVPHMYAHRLPARHAHKRTEIGIGQRSDRTGVALKDFSHIAERLGGCARQDRRCVLARSEHEFEQIIGVS
jgi:hypothetical protein